MLTDGTYYLTKGVTTPRLGQLWSTLTVVSAAFIVRPKKQAATPLRCARAHDVNLSGLFRNSNGIIKLV